jgi:hypothetical protein
MHYAWIPLSCLELQKSGLSEVMVDYTTNLHKKQTSITTQNDPKTTFMQPQQPNFVTTQAVIASEAKQSPSRKEEIASSQKTLLAMTRAG